MSAMKELHTDLITLADRRADCLRDLDIAKMEGRGMVAAQLGNRLMAIDHRINRIAADCGALNEAIDLFDGRIVVAFQHGENSCVVVMGAKGE